MSRITIDELPDIITTDELAELLRLDIEQARRLVRRYKDILKPFNLMGGRSGYRFQREAVQTFYHLMTENKLQTN